MTPEQSIIKNLIMLGVAFVVYRTAEIKNEKIIPIIFHCYDMHVDHSTYSQSNWFPFDSFTRFEPKGRVDLLW